jgi:hypothetical protein
MNRAARDMDCKTVYTFQKRIRFGGKLIRMSPKKTDADQKMIHIEVNCETQDEGQTTNRHEWTQISV